MTSIQNFLQNFNIQNPIAFRSTSTRISTFSPVLTPERDGFSSNPLGSFESKEEIEALAKSNPRIQEIAKKYGFKIKANDSLQALQKGHLQQSRVIAAKIYSALPKDLKEQVNMSDIQQAAMLHDYGKVLIPDKILNKKGAFTEEERAIMQQHSELGYELLKSKGVSANVLNLVKYHHQTPDGSGYPTIDKGYNNSLEAQILRISDEYSALTEERCYKPAMSKQEAIAEILKDVKSGIISQEVYDALAKVV